MKASCLLALLCGAAVGGWADGPRNPRGFAEYEQVVTLQFASAEEAAAAEVMIPELPDREPMAFSTRWDDWNGNHTNMAAVLQKTGMQGTWYLNGRNASLNENEAAIVTRIKEAGTIGAHNASHRSTPLLMPYLMWYEILMGRVHLEAATDQPVMAVVRPNSVSLSDIAYCTPDTVNGIHIRSGFTASPEWNIFHYDESKASSNLLFGAHLFAANDHNPSELDFYRNMVSSWGGSEKSGVKHLTLGVHSHQKPEGFAVLEEIFTNLKRRHPTWWYCNETDYGAWQTQRFHTRLELGEAQGATRTLRLTRIATHDLGSELPLSLVISPAPTSVMLRGAPLAQAPSGVFKIPHDPAWQIPSVIDFLENTNNVALEEGALASAEIQGLSAGLFWDTATGALRGFLKNESEHTLSNLYQRIYLPMQWTRSPASEARSDLAAGTTNAFTFTPKEEDQDPRDEFCEGPLLFVVQYDFMLENKAMRLYVATTQHRDVPRIACPRDCTLFLGPIATNRLTEAEIAALSLPETPLAPLGEDITERWHPIARKPEAVDRPFVITPGLDSEEWTKAAKTMNEGTLLTVIEFETEKPEDCKFYRRFRSKYGVYLNGEAVTQRELPSARAGRNRLVFSFAAHQGRVGNIEYAVSEVGKALEPVRYVTPTAK